MSTSDVTVLVGKKPAMSYVLACLIALQQGQNITLKARGKAISRAVDVVQILRNRFLRDLRVQQINLGTETLKGQDGRDVNVSTIEIKIAH
ncbi:MAG: DNA-binding protein Alba [Thaumarchaeota archaeon]|nr:DNA-binding protein Alba [Candidatus Calditenuaceae archaeon]MDW8186725.1 DNA-binding protein Alba [Nitrososphaerota archaeon]